MARQRTLEQVREAGLEALARKLGVVDMVRFLQQFETGSGDYTEDRHRWLGNRSVRELVEELRQRREAGEL
jgi:LmbE family N-acetylglucosaminyl deacetylase